MKEPVKRSISALLFIEQGSWVGQILEYDIAAQGSKLDEVQYELMRTLMAHIALDVEAGREPLENLPPAPQHYWDMFKDGKRLVADAKPRFRLPKPISIPFVMDEVRVCSVSRDTVSTW